MLFRSVTLKNKPANGLSCLDHLVFPKVIVKIKTRSKNKAICHLAVPEVDSSVIGERPLSGSGKRLFSPRICANSLNLKVQKHETLGLRSLYTEMVSFEKGVKVNGNGLRRALTTGYWK